MASESPTASHFVLVPFMAQGHHIPMADLAQLLAHRGVLVSFITTPLNVARLLPTIRHVEASALPIRFVSLNFPCSEVGLPDGCENLDALPSRSLTGNLLRGAALLRAPLADHLREQARCGHPPTCIVSDAFHPWTADIARELGVPRLVFHGTCCFSLLCLRSIKETGLFARAEDEPLTTRTIPGLVHKIEVSKAQVPGFFAGLDLDEFREEVARSESEADGSVVNSFHELEPWYIDGYSKSTGKKVWAVGPLSIFKKTDPSRTVRGNKSTVDVDRLLTWLDTRVAGSVVYASFGSIASIKPSQLLEIGLGLESSGHPFVWVVKAASEEVEWLGGFEERNGSDRCFIVRGWAPQATILSHPSIGGFVTHCGWNSTLEGLAAGVPMVMWPRFAEQFLNAKLVVEALGVGVAMEVREASSWAGDGEVLGREEVEKAVKRIMEEGEEGQARRERAKDVEEMARKAMDVGGSSYANVTEMIEKMHKHYLSLAPQRRG